jgi:hypothetical protein
MDLVALGPTPDVKAEDRQSLGREGDSDTVRWWGNRDCWQLAGKKPPQGFEPWTSALRKLRSTAELRRQSVKTYAVILVFVPPSPAAAALREHCSTAERSRRIR